MESKNPSKRSRINSSEESGYPTSISCSSRSGSEDPLRETWQESARAYAVNKVVEQFWKLGDSWKVPRHIIEEFHDKMFALLRPYADDINLEESISDPESDEDQDETSTSSEDNEEPPPKRIKSNAVVHELENVEFNESDESLIDSSSDSEDSALPLPQKVKPIENELEPESVEFNESSNFRVDPTKCRLVTAQLAKELLSSLSLEGCVKVAT